VPDNSILQEFISPSGGILSSFHWNQLTIRD
jgi:hypothetical protein